MAPGWAIGITNQIFFIGEEDRGCEGLEVDKEGFFLLWSTLFTKSTLLNE